MPTILTWNMQGGQGTNESKWWYLSGCIGNPEQYLMNRPKVVLLQECSDVPGLVIPQGWAGPPLHTVSGSKNFGTYNKPLCYFVAYYEWGNQNNRVSFAVLIATSANEDPLNKRQLSDDLTGNIVVHDSPVQGTRPIVGVTLGTATYYTMHAPSGVATSVSRNYVSHMLDAAADEGSYVIGGDFNSEPSTLYDALNPIPNGSVYASGSPTCGHKEYDYFTGDGDAQNGTALQDVECVGLLSDHCAVRADC